MHLKIFIFAALLALGTAARQSWKGSNSEENVNKRWKNENSAKKLAQLTKNYDGSQRNVHYQRKDVGKLESPTIESVEQKCSKVLQQEGGLGSKMQSDDFVDHDLISTQIPEDLVDEDFFDEAAQLFLTPTGSYPKKHFVETKKSSNSAANLDNEEEWKIIKEKLEDLFNVLTPKSRQSITAKSRHSIPAKSLQFIPTKSQIGASEQAESRAAEKVEYMSDSEKLVNLDDCAGSSYFKLPLSRKTPAATEGYKLSKNVPKFSPDKRTKVYPERIYVESLADRQLNVLEERSRIISALSAQLESIRSKLTDISELLLANEVDEPV